MPLWLLRLVEGLRCALPRTSRVMRGLRIFLRPFRRGLSAFHVRIRDKSCACASQKPYPHRKRCFRHSGVLVQRYLRNRKRQLLERPYAIPVSLWCHRVRKASVASPKRQCSATTTGSRMAQFHTKNRVLGAVEPVLIQDVLLDTQEVTGSSPVSPSDTSLFDITS